MYGERAGGGSADAAAIADGGGGAGAAGAVARSAHPSPCGQCGFRSVSVSAPVDLLSKLVGIRLTQVAPICSIQKWWKITHEI
jgi:hypothetical protein